MNVMTKLILKTTDQFLFYNIVYIYIYIGKKDECNLLTVNE